MDQVKIVIMAGRWTEWIDFISEASPRATVVAAHTDEELLKEIVDADVVIGRLPREPYLAAKQLKWVQSIGVGFETMLYPEMVESDVVITNTAGAFDPAMGEHTMSLLLACTRGIAIHERNRKARKWHRDAHHTTLLFGATACVLGLGTIGKRIARLLSAFDMNVIGLDAQITEKPDGVNDLRPPDRLHESVVEADVVVVALPLTNGTKGLIDASCFEQMKDTSILINIARGPIVNETDLVEALRTGQIGAAGLDVFEEEPLSEDSPLWDMENVVITPHISSRSDLGDQSIRAIFRENVRRYCEGEPLLHIVDKAKGYVVQKNA